MSDEAPYLRPGRGERLVGRVITMLVRLGLGPSHMRILEVRGRKSGQLRVVPVDVLSERGRLYLVAPRGCTEWVRNVEASGEVTLRRGARVDCYTVRAVPDPEKPEVLKAYLESFRREVQRYFPVAVGSTPAVFAPIAHRYPVYELRAKR